MIKYFFTLLLCFCYFNNSKAQVLKANAGPGKIVCYNANVPVGGSPSATGGTPPYTYDWGVNPALSSYTAANPTILGITQSMWLRLVVTDKLGTKDTSYAYLEVDIIHTFGAGIDTGFCYGQQNGVKIGLASNSNGTSAQTFSWIPTVGLDNPASQNPIATPSVPTVYNLIVSDGICPNNISKVLVTPFIPPVAYAGKDTTIDEGNTITLNGSGGNVFWWQPDTCIKYINTANPDVSPISTITYTLYTEDSHKCSSIDSVRVNVIKGEVLFFYSAFTPNHDGDNDFFYIGNVEKYPDNNLKIFNRYGKLIFNATNYLNTWDGTYLGNTVPTGVYYYIFDTGVGKKYKGTITILR